MIHTSLAEGVPSKTGELSILKILYTLTSLLSLMMVVWILIMPGSWLIGKSKLHDDFLFSRIGPHDVVPPHTLAKYKGHTAVHLTHILPGALWAAMIPFQIHPMMRKFRPRLHRITGYIFVISALLMSFGVFIIINRGLGFENYFDCEDSGIFAISTDVPLLFLTAYFAGAIMVALNAARERKFHAHQVWIVRHIASGMWIAVQRFLLTVVYPMLYEYPVPEMQQKHAFTHAAVIAIAITIVTGECVIYTLQSSHVPPSKKRK